MKTKRIFLFLSLLFLLSTLFTTIFPTFASAAVIPGKLKVGSYDEYEVLAYTFSFERKTDIDLQPLGIPDGGYLTVAVKAKEENCELCDWALSRSLKQNGELTFTDPKTGKKERSIVFKGGICCGYKEQYAEDGTYVEVITIACEELIIGVNTYSTRGFYNESLLDSFDGTEDGSIKPLSAILTASTVSNSSVAGSIVIIVCVVAAAAAVVSLLILKKKSTK